MSSDTTGYNDLDLMAQQHALQTLALVLIAKKVGVSEDPEISSWIDVAEDNARSTLVRLDKQAKERLEKRNRQPRHEEVMMATPQKTAIYIRVLERNVYTIDHFRKWLDRILMEVPEEFRSCVIVEVGDDGDDDSPRPQLSVWYSRMETQEEADQREADDSDQWERRRDKEVDRTKRIRERYGIL